jgi:hypothetical protein
MSIFDYLNHRSRWEELVDEYQIDPDRKHGTIDNLKWYIDNGIKTNRFRQGFEESLGIATMILKEVK